jgi:hypothetical protein
MFGGNSRRKCLYVEGISVRIFRPRDFQKFRQNLDVAAGKRICQVSGATQLSRDFGDGTLAAHESKKSLEVYQHLSLEGSLG